MLDGKKISQTILEKIKIKKFQTKPKFVIIQIGENVASSIYIARKIKIATEIGLIANYYKFETNEKDKIENLIEKLNEDSTVNGIIIQLPILNELKYLLDLIKPEKDIDGLGCFAQGKLAKNQEWLRPCTPAGIISLLKAYDIRLQGADITILGKSLLVGQPLALMLLNEGATVSILGSKTQDIAHYTKNAQIVVCATGKHGIITPEMITETSVIVDVGINKINNQLVGDCTKEVYKKVTFYTPVPGGIGPMTVASLMQNVIKAYEMQNQT